MGPISGEWSHASHTVYSCAENYTLEQQFSSAATGHFKGWLLCKTRVSLSSCILALSLSRLCRGSPWQPTGHGRFWGRPRPAPVSVSVPCRGRGQGQPGGSSPGVGSRCRLSATCSVPTWSLLVPFFLFSLSGMLFHIFSALPVPDETQRV